MSLECEQILRQALVKAGAKPKQATNTGATPLHEACHFASLQTVKYLIQVRIRPTVRS